MKELQPESGALVTVKPLYQPCHLWSPERKIDSCLCCCCKSPSHVWPFATPWTAAHQASLSITIAQSLPKFIFIASMMPASHLILWCPLLLPSIFTTIRDFSNESAVHIRWPKYWSFSFSISCSNEYSGFISLKIDQFDLFAVQGTLRSLVHHHSLKALILCRVLKNWYTQYYI